MKKILALPLAAALLSSFVVASCGGGTVTFGGGGDGGNTKKVIIKGNIRDVSPVSSNDIVVFAYKLPDDDTTDRCPCPPDPSDSTVGKAQVLPDGSLDIALPGVDVGTIGVIFLLDNPGIYADGTIDPGDPVAILDDLNCRLENMEGNVTVTLTDVDISFSATPVSNDPLHPDNACEISDPPATGRARARTLTLAATPATGS